MKSAFKIFLQTLVLFGLPAAAFASTNVTGSNLVQIITNVFIPLIQTLIPILTMLALLGFFWGVATFIWSAGDEKKRAQSRYVMIWGIIAFFVFLSIIGIVNAVQSTFGIGSNSTLVPPSADPSQYNVGSTMSSPGNVLGN